MTRYNPKIDEGLTQKQVQNRISNNLNNICDNVKTKSIGQIVFYNVFTLFNILNLSLGLLILFVRSYKNLFFLGTMVCNTLISIIQEIRSKRIIDKLSIISSTKVNVIRDSKEIEININEVVLDDIVKYKRGNQIVADSIIIDGIVEVNESLISGEEKSITKKVGDMLYSGSFIVGGNCFAKVEHVGENNYSSKITNEARYIKKCNSVIINTLRKVIKIISIIIVPLGILMFIKQMSISNTFEDAIVSSVASVVGMIPEGLVLLTSTVLALSVIRLSKRNVLVQQLYCIETLARVDTICLDKTGTLTEGEMEVEDIIVLNKNYDYQYILSVMSRELTSDSPTMEAISKKFNKIVDYKCLEKEYFNSEKKYSSVTLTDDKYILGAPEILDKSEKIKNLLEKYSNYRIVLLKNKKESIALILLKDKIRFKAKSTLKYFKDQDVNVKIISGDSEKIIRKIANRLELSALKSIDLSKNKVTEEVALNYDIFARVTPEQKKELITHLQKNGKTVAMMGDGVNDVLALKQADCSIAVASGSDAARNVSELVLLDSDFAAIPKIIEEGRRSINNVERSSALFLSKTTYSTLLAIIFLFLSVSYPFEPVQLSLVSTITIGIPAFVLSLEPNNKRIEGNFFINVLKKALPGGLTTVINILSVMIFSKVFNINSDVVSTMGIILISMTGFILLYRICEKFNILRFLLFLFLIILYLSCIIGIPQFFELVLLQPIFSIYVTLIFVLDISLFNMLYDFCEVKLVKNKDKF